MSMSPYEFNPFNHNPLKRVLQAAIDFEAVRGSDVKLFVAATKAFIDDPALAEKYVRETVFKGQLSSQDFRDGMANANYTYDMPAGHMQVTTDYMVKYGLGKMVNPPKSDAEWVKTDLLDKAKAELKTN